MALRMVLAGDDWRSQVYEQALADGLQASGVEVIPFKARDFVGRGLWWRVEYRMRWSPATVRLNHALPRLIAQTSPDVLFLRRMTYLFGSTLERILKNHPGLRVVSYNNDNPYQDGRGWRIWRHYFRTARLSHVNFVFRPADVPLAQRMGLPNPRVLLPWYVEGLHRPLGEIPPDFRNDVVFVGHYEPDGRVETLNYLARQGVSVRVYGGLWDNRASLDPVLRQPPVRAAYGEDYVRVIAGAKIALVFLSGMNRDVYTTRCFEIPACGTAMVAPRTKEMLAMYREGEEAVYFDSKEELLAKVRWLLEDDEARNRIAKAGRERCLRDGHSNIDRSAQIIGVLEGGGSS